MFLFLKGLLMKIAAPTTPKAPSQTIKARFVPVGGVFEYKGETYFRASLKGRKSGKDYGSKLDNPCRGIGLKDGAVCALDNDTVTYHPDAHVSVK